jgi:hypothetical protein
MEYNQETQDLFTLIKYEVVELRPSWEALDINNMEHMYVLLFAAAMLKGNTYSLNANNDDGEAEMITIQSYGQIEGDVHRVAISSDKRGSDLPNKIAAAAGRIFSILNNEDQISKSAE